MKHLIMTVLAVAALLLAGCFGGGPRVHFDNLAYGQPSGGEEPVELVSREGYALGYSEKYKQALWVQYQLTADEVLTRKASRQAGFEPDPAVHHSSTPEDYYTPRAQKGKSPSGKPGEGAYDRGHLAPAGDMHWSEQAMKDSFYMSNVSPQVPAFNRGVWKALEQTVRRFAYSEGAVWVVTGPVFGAHWDGKTIGANKVAVPWGFYKVVYSEKDGGKMIGFVLKNAPGDKENLKQVACSVADVERQTGLTFFEAVPQGQKLKAVYRVSDWQWSEDRRKARRTKGELTGAERAGNAGKKEE